MAGQTLLLARKQKSRAIYLFVMSLWGNGIGLDDEFEADLARASSILCRGEIKKDYGQLANTLSADEHESWTSVFIDKYLVHCPTWVEGSGGRGWATPTKEVPIVSG